MEKLTSGLHALKDFDMKHFEEKFSRRALDRGTLYSMEPGYIDGVKLSADAGDNNLLSS